MKKILTICLAAVLILSFSSCSKAKNVPVDDQVTSDTEISSVSDETMETAPETTADTTTQTSAASTEAASTKTTAAAKITKKTASTQPKSAKSATQNLKNELNKGASTPSSSSSSSAPVKKVTPPVSTKTVSAAQQQYYSTYQNAMKKTNSLTSMDYKSSTEMNFSGSSAVSFKSDANMKVAKNGSDIKVIGEENVQGTGIDSIDMSFYYADGTFYLSTNGEKVKEKMNISDFESATETSVPSSSSGLTEDDFAYSESTSSNGETTITLNLTPESMKRMAGSSLSDIGSDINFSELSYRCVINKDGYIVSEDIECNATVTETENGKSSTENMYLSVKLTINNPGQPVTITPPSDLSSYQDSSVL